MQIQDEAEIHEKDPEKTQYDMHHMQEDETDADGNLLN